MSDDSFEDPSVPIQDSIDNVLETRQWKLALLQEQQRRIAYLKSQLNILETHHRQLKEEVVPYAVPVARSSQESRTNVQPTYVDRLHDEILYIIFKKSLEEEHSNIQGLLLVCQRWNRFIMGCPALWAKIQINWWNQTFRTSPLYSAMSYITACVERSHLAPLDVDLDFTDFPSSEQFLRTETQKSTGSLIDSGLDFHLDNEVEEWNMDWDSPFYTLSVEQLFDCLIGSNGKHMARWSRLTLKLPEEPSMCEWIWTRFKGARPNLNTFSLKGFPDDDDYEYEGLDIEAFFKRGFKDLSSVTDLIILDGPTVSCYPISHTTLQHLSIPFHNDISDLEPLLTLTGLRTLKLKGVGLSKWGPEPRDDFIMHLPQLEKLELSGIYPWLSCISFNLPKLEKLVLTDGPFGKLPKLSPKSISWEIREELHHNLRNAFDWVLSVSPNLETITMAVRPEQRDRILEQIERCKATGSLISSSPHVIIYGIPTEEEVMAKLHEAMALRA